MSKFVQIDQEDPMITLCRMAISTRYEDLPSNVIDFAKQSILDTLAVMIGGSAMARGSVPALWPYRVFSPDMPLIAHAFDHYHQTWIDPYNGAYLHIQNQFWPLGGLELAHAYLRLGREDALHQILGWTLSNNKHTPA